MRLLFIFIFTILISATIYQSTEYSPFAGLSAVIGIILGFFWGFWIGSAIEKMAEADNSKKKSRPK